MSLTPPSHPVWTDIISGKRVLTLNFLAAKIFLGIAKFRYKNDSTQLQALAKELYNIYEQNQKIPNAIKDIEQF